MQQKDTIANEIAILSWEEDDDDDPFASDVEVDLVEDEARRRANHLNLSCHYFCKCALCANRTNAMVFEPIDHALEWFTLVLRE